MFKWVAVKKPLASWTGQKEEPQTHTRKDTFLNSGKALNQPKIQVVLKIQMYHHWSRVYSAIKSIFFFEQMIY